MPSWRYAVSPNITFSVRTRRRRPTLLSRTFGPEVAHGEPGVVLDLGGSAGHEHGTATTTRAVYKAVPWSCEVDRTGEAWGLRFRSPAMREYLAMHIALLPALRYELAMQGVALIPGGAYEDDDGATVIAGPTGAGKTSLLLGSLGHGSRFIGDEYVGLSSAGHVSPVVRSLALRRASLALVPGAADKLSTSRRIGLLAAEFVTTLTQRRLEPLSHVRPEELGMKVADGGADVKRVVWLEPFAASGSPAMQPMSEDELFHRFVERDAVHQEAYRDISLRLQLLAGHDEAGVGWRRALEACLLRVECYRLRFDRERLSEAMGALGTLSPA